MQQLTSSWGYDENKKSMGVLTVIAKAMATVHSCHVMSSYILNADITRHHHGRRRRKGGIIFNECKTGTRKQVIFPFLNKYSKKLLNVPSVMDKKSPSMVLLKR